MKKYLNTLLFMAVALFSAATMVSCGSDDDDELVPGDGNGNKPSVDEVYVCTVYLNQNVLDLCNVSLTLHSGDKSKVVNIDKANGKLVDVVYENSLTNTKLTLPAYRFIFDNVDGNKGIDYVESHSTLKADAESVVNAMEPDVDYWTLSACSFLKKEYQADGSYSVEGYVTTQASGWTRNSLLEVAYDGKKNYERIPNLVDIRLTKKNPDQQ